MSCRCGSGPARLFRCKSKDKFKEKHEYSHTHSHTHEYGRPRWSEDECTCDDCAYRGRPITRTPVVCGEGSPFQQNVNQQNINIVPGYHSPHRDHPRVWEPVLLTPRDYGWSRPVYYPRRHHGLSGYAPITNDDGRVDLIDVPRFIQNARDFADEVQKKRKDEEDAKMRKMYDTADMIKKMFEPDHHDNHRPGAWIPNPDLYGSQRTSAHIKAELERLRADKKQLSMNHAAERERWRNEDQLAMCSGALQEDVQMNTNRVGVAGGVSGTQGRQTPIASRVVEVVDDHGRDLCHCGDC